MVSKNLIRKIFLNSVRYSGLSSLLAPALSGNGAILMLHRVGHPSTQSGINDFLSIEPAFLDQLISKLRVNGIKFVSMDEAVDRIEAGFSDERFAAVTLDDGYRDNKTMAESVFNKHDVPFTIYACTGFADRSAFLWWDVLGTIIDQQPQLTFTADQGEQTINCATRSEKQALYNSLMGYLTRKVDEQAQRQFVAQLAQTYGIDVRTHCKDAIMTWDELKEISQNPLCTIGAHTLNHYHMARLSREDALFECAQSAKILEQKLGVKPQHFAFPYGGPIAAGPREAEIAKEAGMRSAVTTRHGLIHKQHSQHLHGLPRISINGDFQRVGYVKTLLSGIAVPPANKGRKVVTF